MFPTLSILWNATIWSLVVGAVFLVIILKIAKRDWRMEKPKRPFGIYVVKRKRRKGYCWSIEVYARDRLNHIIWYSPASLLPWRRFNEEEPFEVCTEVFTIDKLREKFPKKPKFRPIDPAIQAIINKYDKRIMELINLDRSILHQINNNFTRVVEEFIFKGE